MRITEVRYEKKVQSVKYEPEALSATALVSELDNFDVVVAELKRIVNDALVGHQPEQLELPLGDKGVVTKRDTSVSEKDTEAPESVEPKAEPEKKEEKPKKKVAKKKAAKRTKKEKFVTYDRDEESHKQELGTYLNENYPNWEEDTDKAGRLSKYMDKKTPLYDSKGDLAEEFISTVVNGMGDDCTLPF